LQKSLHTTGEHMLHIGLAPPIFRAGFPRKYHYNKYRSKLLFRSMFPAHPYGGHRASYRGSLYFNVPVRVPIFSCQYAKLWLL